MCHWRGSLNESPNDQEKLSENSLLLERYLGRTESPYFLDDKNKSGAGHKTRKNKQGSLDIRFPGLPSSESRTPQQ